ncbi:MULTISPECIES: branched-chain amino acid ABC transporter substrate-binding protein [unclassified Herbaspirillum]|uniref:branched-chain amino acid ABC transporter substrate-binding protein n=1 Tax=unclassified Herbaspirillum TaxID=2624150 RepID=UPI001314DFC9|nr:MULTISPECIES: branched-chain amino acid ABC transporter substrate-binding protein [unclassified Herbaspirillum]
MKKIRRLFLAVLIHSALSGSPALAASAGDNTHTILIGFAGPLAWPLAQSGQYGVQLAIDEANRAGYSMNGKKMVFKLLAMDDKADVAVAGFIAKSMVAAGVAGVIGHWLSAPTNVAAPIYAAAGVPQISSSAAAPEFTQQGYATSFRAVGSSEDAAIAIAEFATQELKSKRIAIIDDTTAFGARMAELFAEQFRSPNQVVVRSTVSNKTSDFNAVLTQFTAGEVDLIFFGGYLRRSEDLVRARQRLRVPAKLFLTGSVVNPIFLSMIQGAGDGLFASAPGKPYEEHPQFKALEKNFNVKFRTAISVYTVSSYDACNTLIAAIKKANSLEPRMIVEELHKIRHKGLLGTVAFDANGNLQNPAFTVYRIQDQRWVPVKTYDVRRKSCSPDTGTGTGAGTAACDGN